MTWLMKILINQKSVYFLLFTHICVNWLQILRECVFFNDLGMTQSNKHSDKKIVQMRTHPSYYDLAKKSCS